MIVYGDHSERVETHVGLAQLGAGRQRLARISAGLDRHAALVALFIDLTGVAQGVADALFAVEGADRRSAAQDTLAAWLLQVAEAVRLSWDGRFVELGALPEFINTTPLPEEIEIRHAEGYAFYALYPEAYIEAARRLRLSGPVRVIGIRSIGTGLAALVGVVLRAPPPVTLRPIGHPFDRCVSLSDELAAELLADPNASYVIVDEGPGLSGSSFGAVADFLEANGISPERIVFLSGHGGDLGPQACERHRARWAATRCEAADTDALLTQHLHTWASNLLGPLEGPLQDISGGAWRGRFWPAEADWPAVTPLWERRKFLARAGGATWLLKFAGLGAIGERKLARAKALHAAGFAPEPCGVIHGFIAERWLDDAQPLDPNLVTRAKLLDRLACYLGFRAQAFPATSTPGASLDDLLEMARFNTAQALGDSLAARFDDRRHKLACLAESVVPVETDNRCLPHEWLLDRTGCLLKADALDHHAGHDLIGCQDVAWDIAGASIEFDLSTRETQWLQSEIVAIAERSVNGDLVDFLQPCYLAFRLGQHHLAAASLGDWPEEKKRNEAAAGRYARKLEKLLGRALPQNSGGSKQENLCALP